MKGRAIWAAYDDTGALNISCPHCDAEEGTWCTKPDGRVARVPCIARIAAADLAPTTVDFTEPRHPRSTR
ncbi:zinc finger domain-containing protein [Mycolicibacterium mengxianglii]|uniref:zinc finger domain-containing protein n=1 Tax=Mycolicibacterium mengxianglii TaxID=2736649 RepID=UPI0018D1ADF3|nr:hypothetical protein [Mycolicibacterium mengxianglii]